MTKRFTVQALKLDRLEFPSRLHPLPALPPGAGFAALEALDP